MIASPSIGVDEALRAEFESFAAISKPQDAPPESLLAWLVDQALAAEVIRGDLAERAGELRSVLTEVESRLQAAKRRDDFPVIAHHTSERGSVKEALERTETQLLGAIKTSEESAHQRDLAWVLIQNSIAALTQFLSIGDTAELRSNRREVYCWRTLRGLLMPGAPADPYILQAIGASG